MALTTVPASLSATALTLTTAAQPNITSVGTLTGLTVSGNIAGTLTTAAQTNITSVGTLSSLTVSGNIAGTLTTAAQPNITSLGALSSLVVNAGSGTDAGITLQIGTGNSGANDGFIGFKNSSGTEIIRTRYDNPTTSYVISSDTQGDIMTIQRGGRVGISRAPSITNSKLEVGGADDVSLINVEASGNTGGLGIGSTGLKLFHGSSAKMTINSSGNVGIGTGSSNPTAKLQVYDGGIAITTISGSGGQYFSLDNTHTGGRHYALTSTNDSHGSLGGGDFAILDFDVSGNDAARTRFLIDSNGRVGIGTSSPASGLKLQVVNTVGDEWVGDFKHTHADAYGLRVDLSGSTSSIRYAFATYTAGGTGFFVRNNGTVGIGNNAPVVPLNITTAGNTTDGTYYSTITINNTGSSTYSRLRFDRNGSARWAIGLMSDDKFQIGKLYNTVNDNAFVMDSGGHVGMGRVPSTAVNLDIQDSSTSTLTGLRIRNSGQVAGSAVKAIWSLNRDGSDIDFEAGSILVGKQQNWTTTASTVDSYMTFNITENESVVQKLRLDQFAIQGKGIPQQWNAVQSSAGATVSTTGDELSSQQGVLMNQFTVTTYGSAKVIIWYDSGQIGFSSYGAQNPQIAIYQNSGSSGGRGSRINRDHNHDWYPISSGPSRIFVTGQVQTATLSAGTYTFSMYGGVYNGGGSVTAYYNYQATARGSVMLYTVVGV